MVYFIQVIKAIALRYATKYETSFNSSQFRSMSGKDSPQQSSCKMRTRFPDWKKLNKCGLRSRHGFRFSDWKT